ncbi:NfeD family protein [Aeromicrobium sp. Leaf350]|uniref:NfeD family protein n=1 Tax=Aeromicrobium sp. Leaf350 TaxID=2876565 RepID=UPI001E34A18F|nr:NfeD family protein [Aeromicrobium sp. Leaf350]
MTDWVNENLWVVWIGVASVLAVAELLSLDLVLLMFAIAALAAAAASPFMPAWATMIVFGVISILLLAVIRPRFKRKLHSGPTLSVGHHNLVGRPAVVDEPVTDVSGRVMIDGELWTARTATAEHHDVGERLTVVSIEGATAYVAGKVAP